MTTAHAAGPLATQLHTPLDETGARSRIYLESLRTTIFTGGLSAATIVVGVMRTKVRALHLGPTGVGFVRLYTAVADVTQSPGGTSVSSDVRREC
jgi:PST family polysaccharide transporter